MFPCRQEAACSDRPTNKQKPMDIMKSRVKCHDSSNVPASISDSNCSRTITTTKADHRLNKHQHLNTEEYQHQQRTNKEDTQRTPIKKTRGNNYLKIKNSPIQKKSSKNTKKTNKK